MEARRLRSASTTPAREADDARRRTTVATSETTTSMSATSTFSRSSGSIDATPVIRRTLYTRADELEDDDDEEEEEEEEEDYVDEGESDESDESDEEEEEIDEDELAEADDDEYIEVGRATLRSSSGGASDHDYDADSALRMRRAGLRSASGEASAAAPGFFERHRWPGLASQRGRKVARHASRLWQFVLHNSFMAANVLWLLAPLGCFLIAIVVPQYLTTAIRYVDVLTTRAAGQPAAAAGVVEKGTMRSLVQEIVDVKLSAVGDELALLRSAFQAQEREVEALRVLHESLRHVHDEQLKKFSLAESSSALSVHIERVVAKHSEELWTKVVEKTATIDAELLAAAKMQAAMQATVSKQQSELSSIRSLTTPATTSGSAEELVDRQRELRQELSSWKAALEHELQSGMQREILAIEERVSASLLAEKQRLLDSVESLKRADVAGPALASLVEGALAEAEAKRAGRVDYAALANGASVSLWRAIGLMGADGDEFTSASYCKQPPALLGALLSSGELPWWLSRHNGRPETALSETMEIGSCWGIAGASGKLSVKFATRIVVDSITVDHIPERVASDFSSAPHEFRVLGLVGNSVRDTVDAVPFGNFSYVRGSTPSQSFRLTSPISQRSPVEGVTLEIHSNHGHRKYTCLYRFRVHGTPV
ncbi:hypothetical protein PybrP1_010217 [[Pythium] brassicae (nom. inval.)]|nr:hypothetical protein PybrP1_010217 [[Pythium] brassicae (nom. inval.)]